MKKRLIAIDLDGTLLSDSKTTTFPHLIKDVISKVIEKGHIVCIFTGRPWRATKKVYDELGLDTIVINYNGAHIHHPKKYDVLPTVKTIKVNNVINILHDEELQMISNNIAVEGPGFVQIANRRHSDFIESFANVEDDMKVISPIKYEKMIDSPTGVLIEIKKNYAKNIYNIRNFFKSKYGDLAAFSYWDTGKNAPILEFTNFKARKDIALIQVARYYNIPMGNTIAFGDGYNDLEMLKVAGVGVAMSNADPMVKQYANVVSKYTNKEGGVAKFLRWYFSKGHNKVKKTMYCISANNEILKQIEQD